VGFLSVGDNVGASSGTSTNWTRFLLLAVSLVGAPLRSCAMDIMSTEIGSCYVAVSTAAAIERTT
jgi:hypothetical protein